MKVKVVNSLPVNGEEHITDLIGQVFETVDANDLLMSSDIEIFIKNENVIICTDLITDEHIVLNKNEYEIIE